MLLFLSTTTPPIWSVPAQFWPGHGRGRARFRLKDDGHLVVERGVEGSLEPAAQPTLVDRFKRFVSSSTLGSISRFERDDELSGGSGGGGSRAGEVSEFMDAALSTTEDGGPVSDKVTSHSYEMMYGTFLLPLRDRMARQGQNLKFLEISGDCDMQGGKPGLNTTLWSKLLPKAERWVSCVNALPLGTKGMQANILIGDQADAQTVESWVRQSGGEFDVIIDDGRHGNDHIRNSLRVLWSALAPGGVYFVEDLHVSRSAPIENDFTVSDMLHAWSEQLISSRSTRPAKETAANQRAAETTKRHPKPNDLAFLFFQRDAAVLGKLSPAESAAQIVHAMIPDKGVRSLTRRERPLVRNMANRYRREARSTRKDGSEGQVCVLLTATTNIHVDLRKQKPWASHQQVNATERRNMYKHVLRHWLEREPNLPIAFAENSGDDLAWLMHLRKRYKDRLELIRLHRPIQCHPDEIGCFEADAILQAVKSSKYFDSRRSGRRCSHVLKVTARYAPTDSVSKKLEACKPGWHMAVQNRSWGEKSLQWRGSQMLGFKAALAETIFGWSQHGGQCQECHVNKYVHELRMAVNRSHIPASAVCDLPRLNVEPVAQGSNGVRTTWI